MSARTRLWTLAILLVLPSSGWGGGGVISGPPKLAESLLSPRLGGARVIALQWTGRHGRQVTRPLPQPLPIDALHGVVAPPGEWVELTLLLDGPPRIEGAGEVVTLETSSLEVVLETPLTGGTAVDLELSIELPADLAGYDHPALLVALQDGIRVEYRLSAEGAPHRAWLLR